MGGLLVVTRSPQVYKHTASHNIPFATLYSYERSELEYKKYSCGATYVVRHCIYNYNKPLTNLTAIVIYPQI